MMANTLAGNDQRLLFSLLLRQAAGVPKGSKGAPSAQG
ncbi:hypothetical protein GPEL0_01f5065 [Geoanaerobacter pelophilus]|uniref:Uncharacterized protein n=1 Tax=Geoanaerobacter pelophilus TaxID=60036 RepID=A0ABQ0MQS8_9BACT|nr:hypothetical protein GPEL0_01f5065 [Geoanaerobacter pelophilus]